MNAIDHAVLAPDPRAKRTFTRSTRVGVVVVAIIVSLQILGLSGTYLLFSRHYVSTDNAQIDGDRIDFNAPTSGSLTHWTVTQGSVIRPREIRLFRIQSARLPQCNSDRMR